CCFTPLDIVKNITLGARRGAGGGRSPRLPAAPARSRSSFGDTPGRPRGRRQVSAAAPPGTSAPRVPRQRGAHLPGSQELRPRQGAAAAGVSRAAALGFLQERGGKVAAPGCGAASGGWSRTPRRRRSSTAPTSWCWRRSRGPRSPSPRPPASPRQRPRRRSPLSSYRGRLCPGAPPWVSAPQPVEPPGDPGPTETQDAPGAPASEPAQPPGSFQPSS
ncbi:uncharacterized protein LOC144579635, partial [Callithrix jacchus]